MRFDKLSIQVAMHDTGMIGDVLEAYERLILDAMRGDHTLFTTADGIDRLWKVSEPLLEAPPSVRSYAPGSCGPSAIHQLIAPRALRLPFERTWWAPNRTLVGLACLRESRFAGVAASAMSLPIDLSTSVAVRAYNNSEEGRTEYFIVSGFTGLDDLGTVLSYGLVGLIGSIAVLIGHRMLTGRINVEGLFRDKNTQQVSPARVSILVMAYGLVVLWKMISNRIDLKYLVAEANGQELVAVSAPDLPRSSWR